MAFAFAHHQPPRTTLARRRGNGDGEVAMTSKAHVTLLGRTAKQRRTTRRARTRAQSSEGQPLLKEYDVLVVGGGPAGVSGAMRAAQLGRRVLLVDKPKALKEKQGGVDAFFGGPTGLWSKAIRDCGKSMDVTDMRAKGKSDDAIWSEVQASCLQLAKNNAEKTVKVLEQFQVHYVQGTTNSLRQADAELHGAQARVFEVDLAEHATGETLRGVRARNVLLCLGSRATRLPSIPFDDARVFDADSISKLAFLPRSVVIIGLGIVACEFAKIFASLGADVTMLVRGQTSDALGRLGLDPDVARYLIDSLECDNVRILENTSADNISVVDDRVEVRLRDGDDVLTSDVLLAATGRKPHTRENALSLEQAGVRLDERGFVEVDDHLQSTSLPGLFCAGDCVKGPALASTGMYEAERAVAFMLDCDSKAASARSKFPLGVWTVPELASYGHTLAKARELGYDALEGRADFSACLRGRVFAPEGLLKLVFERSSARILGVHIVGADACELIHYGMDLVESRRTVFDCISTIYSAVTYHELFREAALDANGQLEFGIEWQDVLHALLETWLPDKRDVDEDHLRAVFDAIDVNSNGSLDEDELYRCFRELGASVSRENVRSFIFLCDDDGNGTVEFDEFLRVFRVIEEMQRRNADAKAEACEAVVEL